jgi:hypothetical protein
VQKAKAQNSEASYVLNYLKSDKDVDEPAIHKRMHKLSLRQIQKEAGCVYSLSFLPM